MTVVESGVSFYGRLKVGATGLLKCQLGVGMFANTQIWAFPAPERKPQKDNVLS